MSNNEDRLGELREMAEAIGKLADDKERFQTVVEAFRAEDVETFQDALAIAGLFQYCRLICRWLCIKYCVSLCVKLCGPHDEQQELDIEEMREFAKVTERIAKDERLLKRLVEAVDQEDVDAFRAFVDELKLQRYCHQLCHWVCRVRCRRRCRLFCTFPLITAVGHIPTSQIDSQGYASGDSINGADTPFDDFANGVGHHPFGGLTEINGVFNISNPDHYKIEFATNPTGPWTPIMTQMKDRCGAFVEYTRAPDSSSGYYQITPPPPPCPPPGPPDHNGLGYYGFRLTDWPTPNVPNDLYYLKLTVKRGLAEFESPVVPARVDNGWPLPAPGPIIQVQVKDPNGNLTDLPCCGEVAQGDGNVLVISVQGWDPNFSKLTIDLKGGCNFSVPIHTKTYNGNVADTGYPVLTSIEWDPWAANVEECCYNIEVHIYDRTITTNTWSGGHHRVSWHAVKIL